MRRALGNAGDAIFAALYYATIGAFYCFVGALAWLLVCVLGGAETDKMGPVYAAVLITLAALIASGGLTLVALGVSTTARRVRRARSDPPPASRRSV